MKRSISATIVFGIFVLVLSFLTYNIQSNSPDHCKQLFQVNDNNGNPIQGASIEVKEHPNGPIVGTCTTNLLGNCPNEMNLLQGQVYLVQVNLNPGPGSASVVFTACVDPAVLIEVK